MKTNVKLISIIVCLSIGIFIYQNSNQLTTSENIVDKKILYENVYFMQCDDGGFCEIKNYKLASIYNTLFDTYYSLAILKELEIELSDQHKKILTTFYQNIAFDEIIVKNSYDDLENIYYYLKILDLLNCTDVNFKDQLLNSVVALQSDFGYFFSSERMSIDSSGNDLSNDYQGSLLLTTKQAVEILEENNIKYNKELLKNWLNKQYYELDMTLADENQLGLLCSILEINNGKNYLENYHNNVKNYYQIWVDDLIINKDYSSGLVTLFNIYIVGKEVSIDFNLDKYINSFWSEQGFAFMKNHSPNILATYMSVDLLKHAINKEKKNKIKEYVFINKNYDGNFTPSTEFMSSIDSSYYAGIILKDDKDFNRESFKKYILNNIDNISDITIPEALFLIQLAKLYQIDLNEESMYKFLDNSFEKCLLEDPSDITTLDITTIELLLETANLWGYDFSELQRDYIISETRKLMDSIYVDEYDISDKIYIQSLNLLILHYLDPQNINESDVDWLLNNFVNNYDLLGDIKIPLAKWVIKVLNNYSSNNSQFNIPQSVEKDLLIEIKNNNTQGFVSYSADNFATFNSTLDALEIIHFFERG